MDYHDFEEIKSRAIKEVDQNSDFPTENNSIAAGSEEDFIRQLQEEQARKNNLAPEQHKTSEQDNKQKAEKKEKSAQSAKDIRTKIAANRRVKNFLVFVQFYFITAILLAIIFCTSYFIKNIYIKIGLYVFFYINAATYYHTMTKIKFKTRTMLPLEILDKISQGKLALELEKNEVLQESLEEFYVPLNAIVNKMSDMVSKVELSALDLAGNSDALTYFATSMANKTNEQFNSINVIDDSAQDLNSSMQEIRSNVQKAYEISVNSIKEADSSSVEILSLIEEMNRINDMSDKILTTMNFIDDIADETNLLALNAAIQAAHAGEEGKGFGVVASEIKNLAQSSSEATKTIYQIIESTVESIAKGVKASQKAKRELMKIIASIKSTENLMSEINESINKQSETTVQLKENLTTINDLTKNINSDTQNMKSAISNLSGQAQVLTKLITFFELKATPINPDSIIGIDTKNK